jgi:hypothetical protein
VRVTVLRAADGRQRERVVLVGGHRDQTGGARRFDPLLDRPRRAVVEQARGGQPRQLGRLGRVDRLDEPSALHVAVHFPGAPADHGGSKQRQRGEQAVTDRGGPHQSPLVRRPLAARHPGHDRQVLQRLGQEPAVTRARPLRRTLRQPQPRAAAPGAQRVAGILLVTP